MRERSLTQTKTTPKPSFTPVKTGILQRKCPCGNSASLTGKCSECENKRLTLQRRSANRDEVSQVPPIVHEVLNSSGQLLDAETRTFMEPRFGQDFSQVQVHTDAKAAESAQAVNAIAYTVGRHIVFGANKYTSGMHERRKLLAHELTHVIQQQHGSQGIQGKLTLGQARNSKEDEADQVSEIVMRIPESQARKGAKTSALIQNTTIPLLQRRLIVDPNDSIPLPAGTVGPPTPLTHAVQRLINSTCPDGNFNVDVTTGVVTPGVTSPLQTGAGFCEWPGVPYRLDTLNADLASTPAGCRCLCDVINDPQTTTIDFRAGAPSTSPGSRPGAGPGHGGVTTDATAHIDPRFQGQYRIGGRWVDIPFHLIFAHEICGHALPKMRGTHAHRGAIPPDGTPPQEIHAVDVERAIAAEQGLPRRPEDYSGAARQRP